MQGEIQKLWKTEGHWVERLGPGIVFLALGVDASGSPIEGRAVEPGSWSSVSCMM